MIRVAIVEDEQRAAELLWACFASFEQEQGAEFEISRYANAEDFLNQYRGNQDLIMMDIEMPGMNGMKAAERLRRMDQEVVLIFVTNMAQYAVKGYEVDALDFIVKPVRYPDFAFKMKRVLQALELRKQPKLMLSVAGGMKRISLSRLKYVEVSGHSLIYHLLDEEIRVRGSLSKMEEVLRENHFMKCNNCYLVNPRYITEVYGHTVKIGDEELQISHPRRKAFLQELSAWISDGGR